ncbi:MAG: TVP38/TMEM64 family protein [Christensenellales bacterium]|jgi:uncharacterized membrane protein YdjX (TVP38/TMEM64 family)
MMYALTGLFIYLVVLVWHSMHSAVAITLVVTSILILTAGNLAKIKGYETVYKLSIISVYVGVIMIACYDILIYTGFLDRFSNYEELKVFINSTGGKSEIIYILAQFLQVTFIPIPSNIVVMIGDELFGPVKAFLLSMIGLLLGSMFAFFLGKAFGLRLITWIAGKEAIEKYHKLVKGRDKTILFMMFLFPMFPDDLLCMVAGLTSMSYPVFFIMMLLTRSVSIGGTIIFKRGLLNFIPLSGFGIVIWIIIIALTLVLFGYAVKYGDKIENFMLKLVGKIIKKDLTAEPESEEANSDDATESGKVTNEINKISNKESG